MSEIMCVGFIPNCLVHVPIDIDWSLIERQLSKE